MSIQLERRKAVQTDEVAGYERMLEIREFENQINGLFAAGLIRGTTHLCLGQEALDIALAAELRPTDTVMATYRGHGVALALGLTPDAELLAAQIWAENEIPPVSSLLWQGEQYRHKRVRLAYVANDFPSHPAAPLLAGVIAKHDRTKFEVAAYSYGPDSSTEWTEPLRNSFDTYTEIGRESDAKIAARLRAQEIDIAIDLMGYSQGGRPGVFACRPAPLQVN